ncbi:hypothetical protein HETIRDRAFT_390312 [Heterobasidion irregulare TC 32-1]|uniref:Uncharacterized protein n=1 Tax=Heterobasidion irregulare (strain TC 32-1) TaxID=747525 RepID=W4JQS7_HETIT|nr:uncharacterized protein HETIRDRAFT_390312 [Heterobasidion irregulare TC 32-1]ETW75888.1 hypothetical protein HETIRDRAFT_390312 [Heterobasidion irregulare TC 32-1]
MRDSDLVHFLMNGCEPGIHVDQAHILWENFRSPYLGETANNFVTALDHYESNYDPETHYGKTVAIVQSSGTGKSRLIEEISKRIPSISICLRQDERPTTGWPPTDTPAVHFFTRSRAVLKNPHMAEELAAAFLGALIELLLNGIREKPSMSTPKDFLSDWDITDPGSSEQSRRHQLFTQVEDMAEAKLHNHREELRKLRSRPMDDPELSDHRTNALVWHKSLLRVLVRPHMEALSELVHSRGHRRFIIAFDECTTLNSRIGISTDPKLIPPRNEMSLIALQRIVKAADHLILPVKFWFLLLDTNSSLYDLVPPGQIAPSFRLRDKFSMLHPWMYLGFNQHLSNDRLSTPQQALLLRHLKMYGRPYWWALSTGSSLLRAARLKLFGASGFNPGNRNHVFAAFSHRVLLEIGEGEGSSRLAVAAVRNHMRVLMGVADNLVVTEAPSEPILSVAAVTALLEGDNYKRAFDTLLDELILKGLVIDRGLRGELCCQLLMILSRDTGTFKEAGEFVTMTKPPDNPNEEHAIVPLRLSTFLKTLLGPQLGLPLKKNKTRDRLLYNTANVWINFTHIVQVDEIITELTHEFLHKCWSSHAAIQCSFGQPVIDGFFVGYQGDLSQPFDCRNLIYTPWQANAKTKAASYTLVDCLAGPWIVPEQGPRYKPANYLVIFMDLCVSASFQQGQNLRCRLTYGEPQRPGKSADGSATWGGYATEQEVESKRYCLNVRGLSNTYPVINGHKARFKQLFERTIGCSDARFAVHAENLRESVRHLTLG